MAVGGVSAITDLVDIGTGGSEPGWNNVPLDVLTVATFGATAWLKSAVRIPDAARDSAKVGLASGNLWNDGLAFGNGLLDWNG